MNTICLYFINMRQWSAEKRHYCIEQQVGSRKLLKYETFPRALRRSFCIRHQFHFYTNTDTYSRDQPQCRTVQKSKYSHTNPTSCLYVDWLDISAYFLKTTSCEFRHTVLTLPIGMKSSCQSSVISRDNSSATAKWAMPNMNLLFFRTSKTRSNVVQMGLIFFSCDTISCAVLPTHTPHPHVCVLFWCGVHRASKEA